MDPDRFDQGAIDHAHHQEPLIAAILSAEQCLIEDNHHDLPSVVYAADLRFGVIKQLDELVWVERCCDPLYGHRVADAWRLHALSHQRRIDGRQLAGVRTAALRRIADWRQQVFAHDATDRG